MAVDWRSADSEIVSHLQSLIRFDTTNPPGNELLLAQYLAGALEQAGIETRLLVPTGQRAAVVARLRGSGKARPVMLLAHMDVVGVERDKWSCDPFGGIVRDGYVYGRGAIDDKGMLAVNLMTMLLIRRLLEGSGRQLDRDVVLVATSDEETGGEWGVQWLVRNHPELLDAEFAINEGGRVRVMEAGGRYIAIQTSEKISHMVTVRARGPAGHASTPLPDNAVFRLGRALARLADYREPVALDRTTSAFFRQLADVWPDKSESEAMRAIVSSDREESARSAAVLARLPMFDAVMRNGISPTRLAGGIAGNVIPAEASATLNVRTLPGQKISDAIARMAAAIGDPEVEVVLEGEGKEAPPSDPGSPMFDAIAAAARALDPELAVVPYLSTGVTDSAHLRRIGIQAYGILPFPLETVDEKRMHGHDERVPVASLHFGMRLVLDSVLRIAGGEALSGPAAGR